MWEFHISIHSFQQVQEFVRLAADRPFDVTVGNECQSINGKELMGMFSLDYSRPLRVQMHCTEEAYLQFKQDAAPFLVSLP